MQGQVIAWEGGQAVLLLGWSPQLTADSGRSAL